MTASQVIDSTHQSFSGTFFNALVEAIAEASESPWLIAAVADAAPASDDSEPVRIKLTLDGSLPGDFLLEFRRADAALLVSKCLRQPVEEFSDEQAASLLKLVESGIGKVPSALEPEFGKFTVQASLASEPASENAKSIIITATDDDSNRVSIPMFLNPALTEALAVRSPAGSAVEDGGKSMPAAGGKAIREQVNLKLVMDLELNVTLRFGQRQLTLREVLDLTSGSVVELDRQVEEPVELLLEGKVIARGEAVVIDGNYGLRVTEVCQQISPAELR